MELVHGVFLIYLLVPNLFACNVVIFGVQKSLLRKPENFRNNCLILGEGPTDYINDSVREPEKKISIYYIKSKILLEIALQWGWKLPLCQ